RQGSSPRSNATGRSPATRRSRTTHEPMQPNAPVTRVAMSRKISHAEGGRVAPRLGPPTEWTGRTEPATMAAVFHSERFFREAWPQISQAFESPTDAASDVEWIVSVAALDAGARVLDAPCGFGRHSIELARRGYQVTGVDFSETELDRATSRWRARWWRLTRAAAKSKEGAGELIGESEIRLYSAHGLSAMLRPERWGRVELYGGLEGTPFSLDAPRLVLVARK